MIISPSPKIVTVFNLTAFAKIPWSILVTLAGTTRLVIILFPAKFVFVWVVEQEILVTGKPL